MTTQVNRTAQVGIENSTISDLENARKSIGAPVESRVLTISSGFGVPGNDGFLPYSVTFGWSEEV